MVEGQKGDSSGIYCLSAHYLSPEFCISLLKFYLFLSSLRSVQEELLVALAKPFRRSPSAAGDLAGISSGLKCGL